MEIIIYSILCLAGLGLLFGLILGVAAKKFAVEVDPKVEAIRGALPGANCGACGYPGCDGLAGAISKGDAPANACPVGGADCAAKIAEIMGVEAGSADKKVARVKCQGTCSIAKDKLVYEGIKECKAAANVKGGQKACDYGCLGYGTCKDVCTFDAIEIVDGIAKINEEKCTSCGACISACPKRIIELVPYKQKVFVDCNSKDRGKDVKDSCANGCIGCQMCVKACPFDAMSFENNLAVIDYEKCKKLYAMCEKMSYRSYYTSFDKETGKMIPKVK